MKKALLILAMTILMATPVQATELSSEDMTLLSQVVYCEAGNQSLEGKRLVTAVVLNRMDSEAFPNTVQEVLSQEGQFTTYKHLSKAKPTVYDMLAVQLEVNNRSNTEVMFFRTQRYGCGRPLFQCEDHYFSGLKEVSI